MDSKQGLTLIARLKKVFLSISSAVGQKTDHKSLSSMLRLMMVCGGLFFWLGYTAHDSQAFTQHVPNFDLTSQKSTSMPTPTPDPTPIPAAIADTGYPSYYYHSWDIPEEASGPNDFWIEVDLSSQVLTAYRGSQILDSYAVSTGTSSTPTVTGTFKIYSKLPTYTMIGPGYNLPDVPYSMFFYKGYSIHGTYWHNNFGRPMSHGCVNMNTNDAAWIYSQSTIGTYVTVHY